MKIKIPFFAAALIAIFVCDALGRHDTIESTLASADAIAYVQVVSVSEDLRDGMVTHRATLSIIGKSYGLKEAVPFEVSFGNPSEVGTHSVSSDSPIFIIGRRSIVILKLGKGRPDVWRQIHVSEDGKIEEPRVFQSVGFDRGADADFAVDCLIVAMKKKPNPSLPPAAMGNPTSEK